MTETPAFPLAVGVGVGTPFTRDGQTVAHVVAEVEGHTGAHRFEIQQRPGGTTWTLLARIPGLPPTILAPVCTVLDAEHTRAAVTAFYRAPAVPGGSIAAAIAASGVPHQINWTEA